MTTTTAATELTARDLAGRIAAGELTAREAVETQIDRIGAVNAKLNALVMQRFDEARAEAKAADAAQARGDLLGPLHGVPITVKDQFHVRGLPTTFGVARLKGNLAKDDGPMVAALREAGAIILGKTNVPQALALIETTNDTFGRTNNPWNLARVPGGSSGGDAALVAAGGSPLSLGGDLGGSLRIPAAWCGVFTIKPTSRRFSIDSAPVNSAGGLEGIVAQPGPIARTTSDCRLALEVMSAAVASRPTSSNGPAALPNPDELDPAHMKVGVLPVIDGYIPSPAVRRGLEEAAEALRRGGTEVVVWDSAPDTEAGIDLSLRLFMADAMSWTRSVIGSDKPEALLKSDMQALSMPNALLALLGTIMGVSGQRSAARFMRQARKTSAEGYMRLLAERLDYERAFIAAMDEAGLDALLCPAMPIPAPQHGMTPKVQDASGAVMIFNMLGMPAGVVPVTRVKPSEESDRQGSKDWFIQAARKVEEGSAGLPVAVQLAARHWREDVVLSLMGALEAQVRKRRDFPVNPPV